MNSAQILGTKISIGDLIDVHHKIKEEDKEKVQIYRGIVISIKGKATGKSFTVRRIGAGSIGVERIWPVLSPSLVKIEVKQKGQLKRAKLYYLRYRHGREASKVKAEKQEGDKTENKKNGQAKPGKARRGSRTKVSSK